MIILVDDDADQRLALRMALELAGYRVREAAHGAEALRLQRERSASFLITDIFMPEADGFETIEAFRREFPRTRIIALSGGGQRAKRDYLESATLMGVDAAFHKPFEIDKLLDTLRALGGNEGP
jgi:two-component system, chemotaxis family, chemotaxis protein CheY